MTVKVGETLPESFFQATHQAVDMQTGEETTLRLEDYRDKLIILDFWATWCSPCIYSLNKLDTLSRTLNDDRYVVVPVTYQTNEEASRAYAKYRWDFNGIVGDTVLSRIFPHSGLPHMVWVKDGSVISLPRPAYVTGEQISEVLVGGNPNIPQAKNAFDAEGAPYRLPGNNYEGRVSFQSTIAAGDPNYRQQGFKLVRRDGSIQISAINMPLAIGLLYEAFRPLVPKHSRFTGVVLEVSEETMARLKRPKPRTDQYADLAGYQRAYSEWMKKYRYSYTLRLPAAWGEETAYAIMQRDLAQFLSAAFGLEAKIENRPDAVLVVRELQRVTDQSNQ